MSEQETSQLWQRAVSFVARAHQGQLRKDGVTPYVAHPFRVALTVRHRFACADTTALVTALLHDTIEDTTTDFDDLEQQFGQAIALAVAAHTKDARLPEPEREAAYDRQLSVASWQARLVKLADVYDNYCDSDSPEMRLKVVVKARRAIACAGDDQQLQSAIQIVESLISQPDD